MYKTDIWKCIVTGVHLSIYKVHKKTTDILCKILWYLGL